MLEDEVELALLATPSPVVIDIRTVRPCSRTHCHGHQTQAELVAVHDAIDSCYAPLRD